MKVLPTFPENLDPPPSPVGLPPAPMPFLLLLLIYHVTSLIAGMIGVFFVAFAGEVTRRSDLPDVLGLFPGLSPPSAVFEIALRGAVLGIPLGQLFWVCASLWPPARHPLRAATVCASVSGSVFLGCAAFGTSPDIFIFGAGGVDDLRTNDPTLVFINVIGALLAGGTFGFITSSLTLMAERAYGWLIGGRRG